MINRQRKINKNVVKKEDRKSTVSVNKIGSYCNLCILSLIYIYIYIYI